MKSLRLIFLPLLLVFLFSCNNDLINYEKSSSDASNDKIHIVKGYISLSGAVPEEVIPSPSVNAAERSAVPIIDSDYKYFVEAVRTDDIDGTGKILIDDEAKFVPAENGTKGFEISLSEGSWIVTCGVKNIATNKTVLSQTFSAPVEITPDETVSDLHFVVVPQESGEGNIELKLSAVSPVTSIKAFCSDEKWEDVVSGEVKVLEQSGSEYTLKVDNLESGVYNITFKFYGNSDVIFFQTTQTVNVLPVMTTKKWMSGGGSDGTVISDGKLTFTTNNIRKIFYVGDSYYGSEKIASATATGEGSFYLPVDNLQRVFDIIAACDVSSADDYTIYISRKVSGVSTVPSTITTAKAKSITIEGVTGNTVDILDGENNGSVLTVDSEVPVIIKNLKITGGSGSDLSGGSLKNGGGIYINKGTVKLTDGVIVTGNKVAANGGGVYLAGSDANLFMYGKALIGDSAKSLTRASASESNRGNQAGNGAGIYNNGGSVYIGYDSEEHEEPVYSDSTSWYGVRRNYSTSNGAGIFHSSGKLFIASGDISYNLGSSYGSGGGIYCGGKVSLSGGTVKGNSSKLGGGIFVNSSAEVSVSGNVIISGNEASENGGAVYQNGTFNLSGSVSIPYGGSKKKNDFYLCSGITITGSLSGSGTIIAVTPNEYKDNKTILALSSESGTTIPNESNKFKINFDKATDGDFWCIDSSGKLKTELIITSSVLENFTPNSSTVYYIKADSSLTNADVISLFSKIKNNVGTGTSLDLSSTSVTSMDSSMWIYSGITYLTLPDNLNYIQCQLFQNNSQLKEIKISSSNAYFVTEDGILYNKDKTTLYRYPPKKEESTFTLPSSVKKLEYMAFAYDENLVTINGLNKIEDTDYLVFKNSKKLKEVDFSGLTTDKLHYAVFKSCSSLQKVTLSSTVKKIGENFIDCPQLIEIHFKSTEPPIIGWNENESYPPSNVIFMNCNANLKFYVPSGSRNAYMNDTTRTGCFNGPLNNLVSNLDSLIVQE